jgi:hypothetical protein
MYVSCIFWLLKREEKGEEKKNIEENINMDSTSSRNLETEEKRKREGSLVRREGEGKERKMKRGGVSKRLPLFCIWEADHVAASLPQASSFSRACFLCFMHSAYYLPRQALPVLEVPLSFAMHLFCSPCTSASAPHHFLISVHFPHSACLISVSHFRLCMHLRSLEISFLFPHLICSALIPVLYLILCFTCCHLVFLFSVSASF